MWPQIPEDLAPLSAAQVEALRGEIAAAALAVQGNPASTPEDVQTALQMLQTRAQLATVVAEKRVAEQNTAALAAATAALADEQEAEQPEPVTETSTEGDPESTEASTGAGTLAPVVTTTMGVTPQAPSAPVKPARRGASTYLRAVNGKPGASFESWAELAAAVVATAEAAMGAQTKIEVAQIRGEYPEDRRLSDSLALRTEILNGLTDDSELTAAYCAPATPYYGISCMNTTRRPVFNSLPGFQETRMRVSIMPSPSLSDITSGYGIWEDTDDDNPSAIKDCAEITCGSPTEYKMYGIWRCLKVKNLTAMSYPELVEAFLNRLAAAHARLAETTLLEAMAAGTTSIDGRLLGYGGATSILTQIMEYLALYQETQRWDLSGPVEGWSHRIYLTAIKVDIARRRQTDGKPPRIVSDEEVNRMFADAGVNMHWFIDTPSWAIAIPSVATGGNLNLLPQSMPILLAPRGKFALMDRAQLSIGVAPGGLYRDTRTNEDNSFRFFFENFEGVVNTNTCPAHILEIPVCWNGAQIDDIVINCQGGDEAGYQS